MWYFPPTNIPCWEYRGAAWFVGSALAVQPSRACWILSTSRWALNNCGLQLPASAKICQVTSRWIHNNHFGQGLRIGCTDDLKDVCKTSNKKRVRRKRGIHWMEGKWMSKKKLYKHDELLQTKQLCSKKCGFPKSSNSETLGVST